MKKQKLGLAERKREERKTAVAIMRAFQT